MFFFFYDPWIKTISYDSTMLIWVIKIPYDHEDQVLIEPVGQKWPNTANEGLPVR